MPSDDINWEKAAVATAAHQRDYLVEAVKERLAAQSSNETGPAVRVKPLVWRKIDRRTGYGRMISVANAGSGYYEIMVGSQGLFEIYRSGVPTCSVHMTEGAAQVAAQADHDARTLAAIEALTATTTDAENARLREEVAILRAKIAGCQWFWPEGDTSSEACADGPGEVVQNAYGWEEPRGEVVAVARGGVVEITFCAALPPADDADSDDEFWVEEATEKAAATKIAAEIERRAALASSKGEAE